MKLAVIHGPNLDRLGGREPAVYGRVTLDQINAAIAARAAELGAEAVIQQQDGEGGIVRAIHDAQRDCAAIVINPAAYSHYSLAIADAIRASAIPVIEVHLSNIHAREEFRARTVTGAACRAVICGLGAQSYVLGVEAAVAVANEKG